MLSLCKGGMVRAYEDLPRGKAGRKMTTTLNLPRLGLAVIEMTLRDMRQLEKLLSEGVDRPASARGHRDDRILTVYANGVHAWKCLFIHSENVELWAGVADVDIDIIRDNMRQECGRVGGFAEGK